MIKTIVVGVVITGAFLCGLVVYACLAISSKCSEAGEKRERMLHLSNKGE